MRVRGVTAVLALAVAAVLAGIGQGPASAAGVWQTKAPMPTPRAEPSIGVVNGQIHLVGGHLASQLDVHEAYDPATDTWSAKGGRPDVGSGKAYGVVEGVLYETGGVNCCVEVNSTWAYDPSTNAWSSKAPMPTVRSTGVGGVTGGRLYVAGGINTTGAPGVFYGVTEAYDPATNSWTARAPMPTGRERAAGAVIDGIFYVVGGRNASGYLSTLEAYDPATNTWTTKAPMPTARTSLAAAAVGGRLYALGGLNASGVLAAVESYDPATNTWSSEPPMPTARAQLTAAAVGGTIYAIGGDNGAGRVGTNEAFTPVALPPPPEPNVVINTNDSGPGSLRAAIEFSNTNPGPDTIRFAIPPTDPGFNGQWFTIKPQSGLPPLTDNGTTIDGSTQPNTNAFGPEIFLDGTDQAAGQAFSVQSSSNIIDGLAIGNFPFQAILISTQPMPTPLTSNIVRGSYIGLDPTGTAPRANGARPGPFGPLPGVSVSGGVDTIIGGPNPGDRNVISGNAREGVSIAGGSTGTVVEGNYVGTNGTGTAAIANASHGVNLADFQGAANGNTVRGNLISGNAVAGVNLRRVSRNTVRENRVLGNGGAGVEVAGGDDNVIQANSIERNGSDTTILGCRFGCGGIVLGGGASGGLLTNRTVIGGTASGDGNVISGNSNAGIEFRENVGSGTTIQGNLIGTDASGSAAFGNRFAGIAVRGTDTLVGGTTPGARNVISGNGADGIVVGGTGTRIEGNYIGTNAAGTAAIPNGGNGVLMGSFGSGTTVGGTVAEARNVISGNGNAGIRLIGPTLSNTIRSNYIGTDASGTAPLGNVASGVVIANFTGDATPQENLVTANVIGDNGNADPNIGGAGVLIAGANANSNRVQGNWIGTDASATAQLGNGAGGIFLHSGSRDNVIGATGPGAPNTIAFNRGAGVAVLDFGTGTPVRNRISRNAIFSNGGLGIDLGGDGVTPNDPGDADTGPNELMNFPVLEKVKAKKKELVISGTIDTPNPQTVVIEIFANSSGADPSGFGEGERFLGAVTPDADGSFSFDLPSVPEGTVITATATGAAGNTSEFAAAVPAK